MKRRKFLGGVATTVALPFLESLAGYGRRARGAAVCAAPKRFLSWYIPNGINMSQWTPATTGTGWTPSYILAPLAPVQDKLLVLSGFDIQKTAYPAPPPGDHASGTGSFLNQIHLHDNFTDPTRVSVDQLIAKAIGSCTTLPSLELGMEDSSVTGSNDGAPGAYSRTLSWYQGQPLPKIDKPSVAFNRLFAGFNPKATAADVQRRQALRTSVLDHVLGEAKLLNMDLAVDDQHKLDQFTTSVRDLEVRIQKMSSTQQCTPPTAAADPTAYPDKLKAMSDLMVLGFQCDITRVTTFMTGNAGSNVDHSFMGVPAAWHPLSHHGGNAGALDQIKQINRWHIQQLSDFLQKLNAITEANGKTVLDNSTVFFGSEIADGNSHNHWDMPVLLAGSLGGALKVDGRHISFTSIPMNPRPLIGPKGGPPLGNLFISILNAFGIASTTFGESGTGPLADVLP